MLHLNHAGLVKLDNDLNAVKTKVITAKDAVKIKTTRLMSDAQTWFKGKIQMVVFKQLNFDKLASLNNSDKPTIFNNSDNPAAFNSLDKPTGAKHQRFKLAFANTDKPAAFNSSDSPAAFNSLDNSAAFNSSDSPAAFNSLDKPTTAKHQRFKLAFVPHNKPAAFVPHNKPAAFNPHNNPAAFNPHNNPAAFNPHNKFNLMKLYNKPLFNQSISGGDEDPELDDDWTIWM